jgi:hypothetical protein
MTQLTVVPPPAPPTPVVLRSRDGDRPDPPRRVLWACLDAPMGNLQIKDVPAELHDEVRRRAAARSMTIRDYVLEVLREDQRAPLREEWLDALSSAEPVDLAGIDVAELVRAGREDRADDLLRRVAG